MERVKHIVQINILLGAWLIVAPFVLGYSSARPEMTNDFALGVVLIGCSWWILAAMPLTDFSQWLQIVGGLWLIAAPFVLHYGRFSPPFANDLVVGILSLLTSVSATWMLASRVKNAA
jgi:SPW repeat-containing protein